ncbi:MAG: arsenosugar biosynthesis radical SAM protein ArsS, partial [Acidobacteriota bacterium]
PAFSQKLAEVGLDPLRATGIEILQVNVGKLCNQTCAHCHVDAGPDRPEVMSRETMQYCLAALRSSRIGLVDLTGGAPELNPHFEWFVDQVLSLGCKVQVRSNLTILTARKYRHLPRFFSDRELTVVSSLPCYTAENTDRQRGEGVFEKSLEALRMLNAVGYGQAGTGLELHLVYNPLGASLPPCQEMLEADYRRILGEQYGIVFNNLFCITNMPISRFLDFLLREGLYETYLTRLVESFNPAAVRGVMCRNLVSVGWDGRLYDCDFNQMLELPLGPTSPRHIRDFDLQKLEERRIVTRRHCFACTAGAGSSCGGEIAS